MIIIPDVHGRTFWQEPVEKNPEEKVIFLGDYVDPYGYEGLTPEDGMEQLEKIIQLKQERPDMVTLLLGNHDMAYRNPESCYADRHDPQTAKRIHGLFTENSECFQMADMMEIAGKTYLFSHAGFNPVWVDSHPDLLPELMECKTLVDSCNQLLKENDRTFFCALMEISAFRGGYFDGGSIIWADEEEMLYADHPAGIYQIFGHSQQEELPIIQPRYACLDCRRAFYLNEENGSLQQISTKR